ncbi:MAG TPA: hypothetical protein VD971_08480 [Phycisphaerales bacterium]|nr:hypothetical protein [Phycisphaerales bacterium]
MARRRVVPLFDLIPRGNRQDGAVAPPAHAAPTATETNGELKVKPTVRIELKPREAEPPYVHAAAQASRVAHGEPPAIVRMPRAGLYVLIFLALLGMVGTWVFGYVMGQRQKADELAGLIRRDEPRVTEPGTNATLALNNRPHQPAVTPPTQHSQVQPQQTDQQPAAQPTQRQRPQLPPEIAVREEAGVFVPTVPAQWTAQPRPDAPIVTTQGWAALDPRKPGLNYLELATLSYGDAVTAVLYLYLNGVDAFAVPLDSGSSAAKDSPPKYRVIAAEGLEGRETRGAAATRLQSDVERLGGVWLKSLRGPTDFRSPLWKKHNP